MSRRDSRGRGGLRLRILLNLGPSERGRRQPPAREVRCFLGVVVRPGRHAMTVAPTAAPDVSPPVTPRAYYVGDLGSGSRGDSKTITRLSRSPIVHNRTTPRI